MPELVADEDPPTNRCCVMWMRANADRAKPRIREAQLEQAVEPGSTRDEHWSTRRPAAGAAVGPESTRVDPRDRASVEQDELQ